MDHVPARFIKETIANLNYWDPDRETYQIAELCHAKSAWGAITLREVYYSPPLIFVIWNDLTTRTTRFAVKRASVQVLLEDVYLPYSKVTRVSHFHFIEPQPGEFSVIEELNAENVRKICHNFRKNITPAAICFMCRIESDEDLLQRLAVSLSRVNVAYFRQPHNRLATVVVKHVRHRGTLRKFQPLQITEEVLETLGELVSIRLLLSMAFVVPSSSPASAHRCLSKILDGIASSGIGRDFVIVGLEEGEERLKERAIEMMCTFRSYERSPEEGEGVQIMGMLKLLTCVCPYRPNILKRHKKKKGPETADAATSTDDIYLYGSLYEVNGNYEHRIMRSSVPSTCWTEVSNVDFTDDEALEHASAESLLYRKKANAATKRSGPGSECEIVELSRSMSASALEDVPVPEVPMRKISRHASINF